MKDTNFLRLPNGLKPFTFKGKTYRSSQVFQSEDPCEVLAIFAEAKKANPQLQVRERRKGAYKRLRNACISKMVQQIGAGLPKPPPLNPQKLPPGQTQGKLSGKEPDSGGKQGAAEPPPAGEFDIVDGGTKPGGKPPPGSERSAIAPKPKDPPKRPVKGATDDDTNREPPQDTTTAGDPVDLFTGQFFSQQTDLSLPGQGLQLHMTRVYRSGINVFGPFGWGWDHIHNRYLRVLDSGHLAYWTGQLTEVTFLRNGATDFLPPPGIFQTVTRLPGASDRFEMHATEGITTRFERPAGWTEAERIPVVRVEDPHGNRLDYAYDGQNRLSRVTDTDGRWLQFNYGDCGLLEEVQDHTGRRVTYCHAETEEHLVSVQGPGAGTRTCYTYGSRTDARPMRHAIRRVTGSDRRSHVENDYSPDGGWQAGRVVAQRVGGFLYRYRYRQLQVVPADRQFLNVEAVQVEVDDPKRKLTTYTFNYRGDLLDERFRLVADGSFRIVARQMSYDSEGNLTLLRHPDGMEELSTYAVTDPDPRRRGMLLRHELRARPGFPSPSRIVSRMEYTPHHQLPRRSIDENGAETRFWYDFDAGTGTKGDLLRVDLPDAVQPDGTVVSHQIHMSYTARGQLNALITADGTRREFTYGTTGADAGLLTETLTDPGGLALRLTTRYDALGRVVAERDGLGQETRYRHDEDGNVTEVARPAVNGLHGTLGFDYDDTGNVMRTRRPRGAYDDAKLLGRDIEDTIDRTPLGHPCRIVLGANTVSPRVCRIVTDVQGLPQRIVQPDGSQTESCFDERGLVLKQVQTGRDGTRVETRNIYDIAGRLVRVVNPGGSGDTRFDYDAFGRQWRVTAPNGAVGSTAFGPDDQVVEEKIEGDDGYGTRRLLTHRTYDYDSRGRQIRETDFVLGTGASVPPRVFTEYYFDGEDRLRAVVDQRGGRSTTGYDTAGRAVSATDAMGNRVDYGLDAAGRVTTITAHQVERGQMVQRQSRITYDPRGRRVQVQSPGGEVIRYDYDDRDVITSTLSPGQVRDEMTYDAHGGLITLTRDAGGIAATERWELDVMGRPVRTVDAEGKVTRRSYDGLGRLVQEKLDGVAHSQMTYAPGSHELQSVTQPGGGGLQYRYDSAGLLVEIAAQPGPGARSAIPLHRFAYDGLGQVVRAQAGSTVTTCRYDSLGRQTLDQTGTQWHRVSYDDTAGTQLREWSDGRKERLTLDPLQRATRIDRIAAGQLGQEPSALARFTYTGSQFLETSELFGFATTRLSYDDNHRPVAQDISVNGAGIDRQDYRFDPDGQTTVVAGQLQGIARVHGHDSLGRLAQVEDDVALPPLGPGQSRTDQDADIAAARSAALTAATRQGFTYSLADRRTSHLRQTTAIPYVTGPGQHLQRAGSEVMGHSADGDRLFDGQAGYRHNLLGQIEAITPQGQTAGWRYDYDAFGRRVRETSPTGQVLHHGYFGDTRVESWDATGPLFQFTAGAAGLPLAIHGKGASYLPLYDLRANKVGLVDHTGALRERYRYDAFGLGQVMDPGGAPRTRSAFGLPPVFGGLEAIPGLDLYLSRLRVMDPRHGMFLSPDPQGDRDSGDHYAYAGQNPADLSDPDGDLAVMTAVLVAMGVGAVMGLGFNIARQTVGILAKEQKGFSVKEALYATGFGAVAGPVMLFAPELAVVAAGWGVGTGAVTFANGKPVTGAFDMVTSIIPFASRRALAKTVETFKTNFAHSKYLTPKELMIHQWDLRVSKMPSQVGVAYARGRGREPHHAAAVLMTPGKPSLLTDKVECSPMYFMSLVQAVKDQAVGGVYVAAVRVMSLLKDGVNRHFSTRFSHDPYKISTVPVTKSQYLRALDHARGQQTPKVDKVPTKPDPDLPVRWISENACTGGNCSHYTQQVLNAAGQTIGLQPAQLNTGTHPTLHAPELLFNTFKSQASQKWFSFYKGLAAKQMRKKPPPAPSGSGPPASSQRKKS